MLKDNSSDTQSLVHNIFVTEIYKLNNYTEVNLNFFIIIIMRHYCQT